MTCPNALKKALEGFHYSLLAHLYLVLICTPVKVDKTMEMNGDILIRNLKNQIKKQQLKVQVLDEKDIIYLWYLL